jgi:NRAMP (natural resistance-associated macrophage protein)-like metal ion transporter
VTVSHKIPRTMQKKTSKPIGRSDIRTFFARLGPGLITGASDDDPSGIATYSQSGSRFGYSLLWTMVFSYPLIVAIQEISARIGRTTGRGIAANLSRHYPNALLQMVVVLLLAANTINIGADLGAMADALRLLIGGPGLVYVCLFGFGCAALQIYVAYRRYVTILKWLTLALFAYFGTAIVVHIPWKDVGVGLLWPHFTRDSGLWTTVVAIMGTTISPYLFFWQASQEVEDIRAVQERQPLVRKPTQAPDAFERIRIDTWIGMGLSNIVALAIMITTAATLHRTGAVNIETSTQAAEALRPVAGVFAFAVFAIGIIGTGLLSVPVLAGSAAYALGEARRWPIGLARKPRQARAFYATIAVATLGGAALNFAPINPIKALFWSAVINGIVAVPVMTVMMLMGRNRKIMGDFMLGGWLLTIGWLATAVMGVCVLGMVATIIAEG